MQIAFGRVRRKTAPTGEVRTSYIVKFTANDNETHYQIGFAKVMIFLIKPLWYVGLKAVTLADLTL